MRVYVALAALALLLGLVVGAYWKGGRDQDAVWQARAVEAERQARARERELQEAANEITRQHQIERARISADLADALERLRQRPARLPEPARAACEGSTGSELSAEDAGFLTREAARADELAVALDACQRWVDQVTEAFGAPRR